MLAGLAAAGAELHAIEWRVSPRVSLSEIYSDNIGLDVDAQADHEFVTELAPGVGIRGTSGRTEIKLDYALQTLWAARGNEADEINHQLDGSIGLTPIADRLFLDLGGTVRQEIIDSRGRLSTNDINTAGNTETVYTAFVTPSFRWRFDDTADANLTYSYELLRSSTGDEDADVHTVDALLESGEQFQRLPWLLNYSLSAESNDDGTDTIFQLAGAEVRYRIDRTWSAILGAGYENNDFGDSSVDSSDEDSFVWRAGASYAPNPRTFAEAGLQHRFFGTGFFLDLRRTTGRTSITARYEEQPETSVRQRLDREVVPGEDVFGEPLDDPDLQQSFEVPTDSLSRGSDVIVTKRFDAGVTIAGLRTTVDLGGFHERRRPETGDTEKETVFGFDAGAERELSPDTVASLRGSWQRTEEDDTSETLDFWTVALGLQRRFGRDLVTELALEHSEQDDEGEANDYDENRITVGVVYSF